MRKKPALFFILCSSWDFWAFYSIFEHSKTANMAPAKTLHSFCLKLHLIIIKGKIPYGSKFFIKNKRGYYF